MIPTDCSVNILKEVYTMEKIDKQHIHPQKQRLESKEYVSRYV